MSKAESPQGSPKPIATASDELIRLARQGYYLQRATTEIWRLTRRDNTREAPPTEPQSVRTR
jgi:hypothetical protein